MSSRLSFPPHLRERWREPALSMLLLVQCVTIFGLVPATAATSLIPQTVVGVLPLTFSSIVVVTSRGKWSLHMGMAAFGMSIAVAILDHWLINTTAVITEDIAAIITFGLLSAVVFEAVYGPGRFTPHRLRGAVVLYLNIGMLFTLIDRVINTVSPGAYLHLPAATHEAALRATLEYFSFSNLTSLGIGDITPVDPFARAMSVLEAAVGQLFPATFLARAVTRSMRAENRAEGAD